MKKTKFNIGDKVIHETLGDSGFITKLYHRESDGEVLYYIDFIGKWSGKNTPPFYDFTLKLDKSYYRENKLNSIGIQ
jgi:hypothetical protein